MKYLDFVGNTWKDARPSAATKTSGAPSCERGVLSRFCKCTYTIFCLPDQSSSSCLA